MRTSLRSLPYSFSGVGSSGGKGTISSGLLDMSPTDAFTFTCFFYQHKTASSENQRIFGNATTGVTESERAGIFINITQNDQTIVVGHNTGSLSFTTNEAIIAGKWYFLAVTQNANNDSSSVRVYLAPVGGELLEKSTNTSGVDWSTSYDYTTKSFVIGARGGDNNLEWNGYIQDIQVHDKVLPLDAINDIYKRNKVLPSLVGRWAGPNAVSGSTIYEELGSGYDISVTGGASIAAASAFGARSSASGRHESLSDSYALSFDGSTSYTTFGSSVWNYEYTDSFSVSFWTNANTSLYGEYVSKRLGAPVWRGWSIFNQSGYEGKVSFRLSGTTATNALVVASDGTIPTGKWSHVVVTYGGSPTPSSVVIYIDGVAQSLTTVTNAFSGTMVSSANASIGCRNGTTENIITGSIGTVHIFDRVLTSGEVASMYFNNKAPGDAVNSYLMREQSGSTIVDTGSGGADGTATNTSWTTGPLTTRSSATRSSA